MKLLKMNLQYFAGITSPTGPGGYRNPSKSKSATSAAKSAGSKAASSKSSSASSGSSGADSGAVDRAQWETGTGIAFMGQMSAQIVHDVMFKFILGDADMNNNTSKIDLMYRYNIGNQAVSLRHLIDMDIPDDAGEWIANPEINNRYNIFNPDECMNADPTEYLQFEGTLMDFINALSNQPFNEVYWTHEEEDDYTDTIGPAQERAIQDDATDPYSAEQSNDAVVNNAALPNTNSNIMPFPHATLHYRQTPFEPNQWFQLPKLYINDNDIINYQLDNNDDEEYSVYNITNSSELLPQISNMPPVTDDHEELQRKYGYKYMDITSEYFVNTKSQVDLSTSDLVNAITRQDEDTQTGLAGIGYPSFETFEDYFGPDSASQIIKNKDPVLDASLPMSTLQGGTQLYDDACSLLEKHLDGYVQDLLNYELAKLLITYQETLTDEQEVQSYNSSVSSNAQVSSVSSPLQLPAGYAGFNNGANPVYEQWQSDLLQLRNLWQTGNINTANGLDDDLRTLINEPENEAREPNGDLVSNLHNDHIITLQKAGQLAMHYMLSLEGASGAINGLLTNPGVIALNPWLGQVEQQGSGSSNSSSGSSSSGKSSSSKSSKAPNTTFGSEPWN